MKTVYAVKAYQWSGTEYEKAIIAAYPDMASAKRKYNQMRVCADTPQIELWEQAINKYNCLESETQIAQKD